MLDLDSGAGSVTLASMSSSCASKHQLTALDAELINAFVVVQTPEVLDVLAETVSTSSYLLERSISRQQARVCLAEAQSAGRGRHGNNWLSTPHKNIMLSLSWGFCGWPQDVSALSLAVGLGITVMLNDEYGIGATIKWPNDVLVNGAKLAGILIDVAGHSKSDCQLVVGVGLNVDQDGWSNDLEYQWCDLKGLGIDIDRNQLAAKLIDTLVIVLRDFESNGFAPLTEAWNELSAFAGQQVRVIQSGDNIDGQMLGVKADGSLVIQDKHGQQHFISDSRASVRKIS